MDQRRKTKVRASHVLVIDDSEDNREIYVEYLRYSGLRVSSASSAEEGLTKAKAAPPTLVVMDLALPGIDGYEATRRLRADPRTRGARILVVTGHALPEYTDRAIAAGADAVCTKPLLPDELLVRLRALLGSEGSGGSTVGN